LQTPGWYSPDTSEPRGWGAEELAAEIVIETSSYDARLGPTRV